MTSFQKLLLPSHFLLTLTSILVGNLVWLPVGYGHLASIYNDGKDVRLGGYTFRVHPKKGEIKPPTLEHTRSSRVPLLHSPQQLDIGRLPFLRHPSYTHKYLSNQRLLKFHQGSPSVPASRIGGPELPTSDASMERLFSRMDSDNGAEVNSDSPTFTPYISARALSNMEKFFHHLRENLEALQKGSGDEDGEDFDNGSQQRDDNEESSGPASPEKALASSYQLSPASTPEWKPRASGVLGLKKIRSFFPISQNPESRTRMGTNLGLGKKRRR